MVRRLALTATPIELEASQWVQMLKRIGVGKERNKITEAVKNYVEAVAAVRAAPTNREWRRRFREAARRFEEHLGPYLLRRDKRGEGAIKCFQELTDEDFHAYRQLEPITVVTARQDGRWKQAVCAAEALSFAARHTLNREVQRLRLTLANGHGIASLLDQPLMRINDKADNAQIEAERAREKDDGGCALTAPRGHGERKREKRIHWWWNRLNKPFINRESFLAEHPAILAAVEYIESVCRMGEKVLVFGRFKVPLRAITHLLNAREMLRCLDEKRRWPQSALRKDEWKLAQIADKQVHDGQPVWKSEESLNQALSKQFITKTSNNRRLRARLMKDLEAGFQKRPDAWAQSLLQMLPPAQEEKFLQYVVRGIQELLGTPWKKDGAETISGAFAELMRAVSGHSETNDSGRGRLDKRQAKKCWEQLEEEYKDYNGRGGRFARLMDGNTGASTRRFLQLAFNRKRSNLKVLVAQSLVGREGLNLHQACRTVVLLHLEWNPGVVEQQIGRVDRIASLWEQMVREAHQGGKSHKIVPRIHIRPVIFQGTYDERQWAVLERRWDELRAQLHGLIISPHLAAGDPETAMLIKKINRAAPDFSPTKGRRTDR